MLCYIYRYYVVRIKGSRTITTYNVKKLGYRAQKVYKHGSMMGVQLIFLGTRKMLTKKQTCTELALNYFLLPNFKMPVQFSSFTFVYFNVNK